MFEKPIKYLLFLTALTPLVVFLSSLYPFIFPKAVFFRGLIEIIAMLTGLFFIFQFSEAKKLLKKKLNVFKNPIYVFWVLFFSSVTISTFAAENVYKAFWGTIERGDGFFTLLHIFIFFTLSILFFSRENWLQFFKVSLGVGTVVILYGFFQFLGIENFPFAFEPSTRPGSFIGNSSFFAAYLFLLIGQALIVLFSSLKNWGIFSGILVSASVLMIFITGTRGAIVGMAVSVLFLLVYLSFSAKFRALEVKKISLKKISGAVLVFIIAFSFIFFVTKSSPLWQEIPGLDRLANTSFSNIEDNSTQNRILTWGVSWEAFKEKPIFGWGPENYITAYAKYYNPDYALYGETWLDRAHNIVFDLLVTQGLFGLTSYLLFFGSVIYVLVKRKNLLDILLVGVFIGYFVQNLFVFDQLNTWIPFYVLVGFLIHRTSKDDKETQFSFRRLLLAKGIVLVLFAGTALYYNVIPLSQARLVVAARYLDPNKDTELIATKLQSAFYPYNYAQPGIRSYIFDYYYGNGAYVIGDPRYGEISELLEDGINEVLSRQPDYDPRWYIRQAHFYETKAKVSPELYKRVEEAMTKALVLAPYRQEIYYNLILGLAGQENYAEAITIAQQAVDLSPDVARAHFFLGLAHSAAGNNQQTIEKLQKARALDSDLSSFFDSDIRGFLTLYNAAGDRQKISEFIVETIGKRPYIWFQPQFLNTALYHFLVQEDAKSFVKVAEKIKEANPRMAEGMDVLIDLAEKERWNIINSLVEFQY